MRYPEAMPIPLSPTPSPASAFVSGGGTMGARLRAFDWSATPLGPIAEWPGALRIAVDQMMSSLFPACLFWGSDLIAIYNDGYARILGQKPDALGRPLRMTWAEVWDGLRPIAAKALAGEPTYIEDFRLDIERHGDGHLEETYFTFCYSPVFDADSKVLGMIDTVIETTAKVKAERRALQERERQQTMLQQMPGFVGVLAGPEHRFEYVNQAYRTISGPRDFIGRTVREVFPELRGQGFFEMLDRVYATGEPISAKALPIQLDREEGDRFIDLVYEPIRDAQGQVEGIFVGGYDVTERMKAEAVLLATQQRLHAMTEMTLAERTAERDILARIVGTTIAQIQVVDTQYRLLAINAACADEYLRLFGFRPKVGDNLLDVLARLPNAADREASIALWRRVLEGESFKIQHEWGDAQDRHWFEMSFEVLRDADGRQTGAFLTGNEVTEQRRAQAALAETQDALRQSQKMEAVGQLTGGIAHDFNNLLAAISSGLQAMKVKLARGHTEGLDRYVEIGEKSVRRAAALTHRLLAFSRRQTLDPQPTDVNRLVRSMEDLVRHTVGPAVAFHFEEAPELWTTRIDPSQLENSLLNLCINARDAMSLKGGPLSIQTSNTHLSGHAADELNLEAGDYVCIAVSDQGTGIAPEDVPRIFEPFFTTKPIGQGTGLGLSMVYGFVQQSEGQVQVTSMLGQGTTIRLYLPRHDGRADQASTMLGTAGLPQGDGEAVLLIEDEDMLRELMAELLAEAGYRVLTASDGPEGLRRLQGPERIDLMVTDVGLPGGLNGRQVADAGRVLRPRLKVLFVTGYAEKLAVGNGQMEPGMAVMTKPFEIEDLALKVKDMLAHPIEACP
jgi:PAS domain S-box-containing protein